MCLLGLIVSAVELRLLGRRLLGLLVATALRQALVTGLTEVLVAIGTKVRLSLGALNQVGSQAEVATAAAAVVHVGLADDALLLQTGSARLDPRFLVEEGVAGVALLEAAARGEIVELLEDLVDLGL